MKFSLVTSGDGAVNSLSTYLFIVSGVVVTAGPAMAMELFKPPVRSAPRSAQFAPEDRVIPEGPAPSPRTPMRPSPPMAPAEPEYEPEPETANDLNESGYSGDAAIAEGGLISPIKNGSCTLSGRTMGCFRHPITGGYSYHHGVDMQAPSGTPLVAPADNCKIQKQRDPYPGQRKGPGNVVLLTCGEYMFRFLHLSRFSNANGKIKKGDVIGYVGSTGHSTGPHLHFEVKKRGVRVNPLAVFSGRGTLCKNVKPPARRFSDEMCHDGQRYRNHHHHDHEQPRSRRRGVRR